MRGDGNEIGYGRRARWRDPSGWRRRVRLLALALAVAGSCWAVWAVIEVRGRLTPGGTRSRGTETFRFTDDAAARRFASRVGSPGFRRAVAAAAAAARPEAVFAADDPAFHVALDPGGARVFVAAEYAVWARRRYSLSAWAYVLDHEDPDAAERNRTMETAIDRELRRAAGEAHEPPSTRP